MIQPMTQLLLFSSLNIGTVTSCQVLSWYGVVSAPPCQGERCQLTAFDD
jgi:hypothetical protein